eukprot:UN04876
MKYKFVTPWTSMIVVKQKPQKQKQKHHYPTPQHEYPTPVDNIYDKLLADSDAAINYGRRLQDRTDAAGGRAIRDLAETHEIAINTACMLQDQTEQIGLIDRDLAEIDDEINRATRIIKRMGRRIMSDKYIWCLIILIVLTIIGIIIGSVVNGETSSENNHI